MSFESGRHSFTVRSEEQETTALLPDVRHMSLTQWVWAWTCERKEDADGLARGARGVAGCKNSSSSTLSGELGWSEDIVFEGVIVVLVAMVSLSLSDCVVVARGFEDCVRSVWRSHEQIEPSRPAEYL